VVVAFLRTIYVARVVLARNVSLKKKIVVSGGRWVVCPLWLVLGHKSTILER
jgi:hypothetical protein